MAVVMNSHVFFLRMLIVIAPVIYVFLETRPETMMLERRNDSVLAYKMTSRLIPSTCFHKLLIRTDGSVPLGLKTDNETVDLRHYTVSILTVVAVLNFIFSVITPGIAVI
jgi:hypothetical protein